MACLPSTYSLPCNNLEGKYVEAILLPQEITLLLTQMPLFLTQAAETACLSFAYRFIGDWTKA